MNITLALGGGGARGVAHVGVLKELARLGFSIKAIAGTSIGSVVGAFFAAGFTPDEIIQIFSDVDQQRLFGWPLSDGPGLLGLQGLTDLLKQHLNGLQIEELRIPFAAIAVDINSSREIFLNSGNLIDAVLASIAVPGLFPPKVIGPYRLIDGGTLDPIPVRSARSLYPEAAVVAVSLMMPLETPSLPIEIVSLPADNRIVKQISQLNITQAFKIFNESIDIGSRAMAELRLQIDKPDVVIRPDVRGINLLDRVDIQKTVNIGEKAVEVTLPALYKAVSFSQKLKRQVAQFTQRFAP